MDPRSPSHGALTAVRPIGAVEDHTVDIRTNGHQSAAERDLTDALMFSAQWLAAHNATDPVDPAKGGASCTLRHMMGTGPFKLRAFVPDSWIVFIANPTWRQAANREHNLDKAIFRPIKSASTRVAALRRTRSTRCRSRTWTASPARRSSR